MTYNDDLIEHAREHALLAWRAVNSFDPTEDELQEVLDEMENRNTGVGALAVVNWINNEREREQSQAKAEQESQFEAWARARGMTVPTPTNDSGPSVNPLTPTPTPQTQTSNPANSEVVSSTQTSNVSWNPQPNVSTGSVETPPPSDHTQQQA